MWDGWHMGGGCGWGFGMIWFVVFWGLVLFGLVFLVRYLARGNRPVGPQGEQPLEILKRRYARGEISREEFEEKKRDMS